MAVCLAKRDYEVVGVDSDPHIIQILEKGEVPFYEPNLEDYLAGALRNKKLTVTQDPSTNSRSDLAYIAVGTPSQPDGMIDLTYVREAAKTIGRSLRDAGRNQLVVIKSTVTPGTARNIVKPTIEHESEKTAGKDFSVCSNPEFLREGNAIRDTESPDRIIIGSDDPAAMKKLETVYRRFHRGKFPSLVKTSFENAELTKYANNAFLATKVSFINSIANIAERVPHADVNSVAAGIGLDARIGPQFLQAGLGWGGSCFPKDLNAISSFSKSVGYDLELINAAIETNRKQAAKATQLAKQALGSLVGKHISILGLAFKPETDDMREAISISVVNGLLAEEGSVKVWDPQAMENARRIFGDRVEYATNALNCIEQTDCCILSTEWPEFKELRPETFLKHMRQPIIIDGRRLYDADNFRKSGVRLFAIGLGPSI